MKRQLMDHSDSGYHCPKRKLVRTSSLRQRLPSKKIQLPQLSTRGTCTRPSTASSFSTRGDKNNVSNCKESSSLLLGTSNFDHKRVSLINRNPDHRNNLGKKVVRPFTASAVDKVNCSQWWQKDTDQLSRVDTFRLRQQERERNRAIIYATNSVMRIAFHKEFKQQQMVKKTRIK